jgi:hypothetical protein
MKRKIPGLCQSPTVDQKHAAGTYLVRVVSARYYTHRIPCLGLTFIIDDPADHRGLKIISRIDCRPKSFWKLSWFLKDFGYDPALLYDDEIDEKAIVGLRGVITISNRVRGQQSSCKIQSFAPAHLWHGASELLKTPGNQELAS